MISNEWLAPCYVETPDIVADIAQLIYPEFTGTIFNTLKSDNRDKLTVLAERLEFIEHLTKVVMLLEKRKSVKTKKTLLSENRDRITKTYSIMLDGHEFAGFDFDSDALSVYLLLTCIDTIKGQPSYVDAFGWLKKRCANELNFDWDALSNEYKQQFGLSRRFKEAFTHDCSPNLRKVIAKNFAVAKVVDQNITKESASAWNIRSEIKRVERIASELYTLRSSFTHASLRSFSPALPVANSFEQKGSVLLQRGDGPLLKQVLTDVIKYLAKIHLIENDRSEKLREQSQFTENDRAK